MSAHACQRTLADMQRHVLLTSVCFRLYVKAIA
jgi:hypothetical protein